MSDFVSTSITVEEEMHVNATPEQVWPQLCPVREYDWIETWNCDLIHSKSGYNELGCVFQTDFPLEGGVETWITSRFELNKRLEFIRSNNSRVIHFSIELEQTDEGTKMTWSQHVVPLNKQGNEYVKTKPKAFAGQMAMVERMLDHYLRTGQMLRGSDPGLLKVVTDAHSG